ncbi:hypothetical protein R1flu_021387 [Riccia fluitans]|uniref:PCI domain-containing protein n=1 Tax=Riccia fluitans TaxID=41844 RepID=A0ABD1ZSG4_9MARC
MEQPIVFGRGSQVSRSSERAAVSDRGIAGGSLRRGRDRPRTPSPTALKQQAFASQLGGRGLARSPGQQQSFRGYTKPSDSQQFGQQQVGRGQGRGTDQQQFGQQLGRGYGRSHEQQQSATQQKENAKTPDQQREEEAAKARRLVRFREEKKFSGPPARQGTKPGPVERQAPRTSPIAGRGTPLESGNKSSQDGSLGKREPTPVRRPDAIIDDLAELDGQENLTAEAILGVCPDMCPETERDERERKGDLDRFERVEGDRNQTSVDLAVKKYTRTAEKDAVLIRPLHVLKSTMSYLLSLLEREHDDDLLSVHNFLWDRMRAVRMDLRMQHIFGEDAIRMHEQMIRFHIVAMHELCEYVQGEAGVSEGFNAHLNIEQMNKTSVDLFQMYDDHRKRGISVPSEAEFRGYYALLKLDKHPGYRVEPAELSLDLAKMSPDIRKSPQVFFAREVARACRGSNYVAFFRLSRKASYLQACLMHAHFAKLRTQALASLHSGLQKNQGIPLEKITDWLGMEEEDGMEDLVRYHGFSIKLYEVPYMVKEGPFLNKDKDFPTSRSQLVEAKRSALIADDVQSGKILDVVPDAGSKLRKIESLRRNEVKERPSWVDGIPTVSHVETSVNIPVFEPVGSFADTVEEDMPDYEEEQPSQSEVVVEIPRPPIVYMIPVSVKSPTKRTNEEDEAKQKKKRRMEEIQFEAEEHERRRLKHEADAAAGRAVRQALAAEARRQEEKLRGAAYKAEADIGKQRLWFRKWRRRAVAKALERQLKLERAEAALNTLSLGVSLRKPQVAGGDFLSVNERRAYLEQFMEERAVKLQRFWATVKVPRLVLPILHQINPSEKFLYWSVLLSAEGSSVGDWVRSKISSKGLPKVAEGSARGCALGVEVADEKKIFFYDEDGSTMGLWYTAKEVAYGRVRADPDFSFHGTSGLIFVTKADESVSSEQARFHTLVQAVADGVSVPLLVLSARADNNDGADAERSSVDKKWDLLLKSGEMSSRKVSKHKVFFIGISSELDDEMTYFNEEALVDGLEWLAGHSPIQPQLRSVFVVDLVQEHLDPHLDLQLKVAPADIRPEHCISVFNKALEKAAEEIKTTGCLVPLNWPPDSRSRSAEERKSLTPETAWNHRRNLESLLASLQSCLLPAFSSVPNFDSGDHLSGQKAKLESVLLEYLSRLEGTSTDNPTMRWEVSRVVQRSCTVGRSRRGPYLIPKWARMFNVLFANRLLLLNRMVPAPVYVSRLVKRAPLELLEFENDFISLSHFTNTAERSFPAEPSLDDLIGVTAYDHERRPRPDALDQSTLLPVRQMRTPLGGGRSRVVADNYQFPSTPTSTPEVSVKSVNLKKGLAPDEIQKQDPGSYITQREADWLVFRASLAVPEHVQLEVTEAELLLDEMIQELDMWESSLTHDHPDTAVSRESPDRLNREAINAADGQDVLAMHVPSHQRRKPGPRTAELELTDSEILLENLVAEFSKASGKIEASPSKSNDCSSAEHMLEYNHVQTAGTGAALGIS